MSVRRRLLLCSSDQRGPGTLCGGVRIMAEALRQIDGLCVLAITDTPAIAAFTPTTGFDHVLLPPSAPSSRLTAGLRERIFSTVLSNFEPDVVVAMRPAGGCEGFLRLLGEERARRPALRAALALWDVPGDSEIEVLTDNGERLDDLFDETWSFGDPSVHDRRSYLPPSLANGLIDLGYLTYDRAKRPNTTNGNGRPRVSVSLGTGWLTLDAVGALRAALVRPALKSVDKELVPNAVLGQRRSARFSEMLGIGLRWVGRPPMGSGHDVMVSTGGYNSVCAVLSTSASPILIHDAGVSSAGVRGTALSDLGICSRLDLGASEPADIEGEILDAIERPAQAHNLRSGGATAATDRVLSLLRDAAIATPGWPKT